MSSTKLNKILHTLEDMQATEIMVLDVQQQTAVTDYMIVASGRSSRHVTAIAEKLLEEMKHAKIPALSSVGIQNGEWALIDFGDFIIHIMQKEIRAFYNLEELWEENP